MQQSYTEDPSWVETYRMSEVARLETQQTDPLKNLDVERTLVISHEAIERRWEKQNPRTAERMRTLLRLRFIEDKSLDECGVALDVTRERVRQMEAQLVQTVRDHLHRMGVTA